MRRAPVGTNVVVGGVGAAATVVDDVDCGAAGTVIGSVVGIVAGRSCAGGAGDVVVGLAIDVSTDAREAVAGGGAISELTTSLGTARGNPTMATPASKASTATATSSATLPTVPARL
jgi:hypothetical protein